MAGKGGRKRSKLRGNPEKAQFPPSLAAIVSETVRMWRKHHLGYAQTKYVVEQARRRLKLTSIGGSPEDGGSSRQVVSALSGVPRTTIPPRTEEDSGRGTFDRGDLKEVLGRFPPYGASIDFFVESTACEQDQGAGTSLIGKTISVTRAYHERSGRVRSRRRRALRSSRIAGP